MIFHGIVKNKALLLAQVNTGLILVEKERNNAQNRLNAKLDVMSVLLNEKTVFICPETNRISRIHISYGEGVVVKEKDAIVEKLTEYEEKISTMRWRLIEEKGMYKKKEVNNWEYINLLRMNLNSLKSVDAEIDLERGRIQGANQEFYMFHHINDVPWNEKGELLQTDEVERLKKINMIHGI